MTSRQELADTLGTHVGILDAIGLDDRRLERLQDRVDADRSRRDLTTRETVEAARRLASAEHRLRRRAAVAHGFWSRHHQRADMDEYLQATADARECREQLSELLLGDEDLIGEVMRRAGR